MQIEDLKSSITKSQQWRHDLKVGDWVDVNVVADEKRKAIGWLQAQIESVDGDNITLAFIGSDPGFD